jgi:hypothetical protein
MTDVILLTTVAAVTVALNVALALDLRGYPHG